MKELLKNLISTILKIIVLPFYIFYKMETFFIKTEQPFCGMSQFFSLIPGLIGEYARREFYKLSLKKCSNNCCISFGTIFSHSDAEIGEGVYIGAYCSIGTASIGNGALIGTKVDIISGKAQHLFCNPDLPLKEQACAFKRIFIGKNTWIGNGAIIMADVGAKCIIGA